VLPRGAYLSHREWPPSALQGSDGVFLRAVCATPRHVHGDVFGNSRSALFLAGFSSQPTQSAKIAFDAWGSIPVLGAFGGAKSEAPSKARIIVTLRTVPAHLSCPRTRKQAMLHMV